MPVGQPAAFPEPASDLERIDTGGLPPAHLVADPMQRPMMAAAERHCKFVTDLAAQRSRLGESQMMGSDGLRPQIRQACCATNRRCSLLRWRLGSGSASTLLSMPDD